METKTFKYADDVLAFIEELMIDGIRQIQVAKNLDDEWTISFPVANAYEV